MIAGWRGQWMYRYRQHFAQTRIQVGSLHERCAIAARAEGPLTLSTRAPPNHGTSKGAAAYRVQTVSVSNAVRLRVSGLNSTATIWIGSPRARYLSA